MGVLAVTKTIITAAAITKAQIQVTIGPKAQTSAIVIDVRLRDVQ